ncbi:MAG: hypothetical protein L0206_07850 [Actinobacteria bacterium]|nr:hypothetical protein [Actinomycetota bacterium]
MRGAPITVRCDCGQVERVAYGHTWVCPDCGRRWNTEQIPPDEYWGIMREMRRYRLQAIGVSVLIGLGFAIVVANVSSRRLFPLALALMAFWFLVYMPRWRQKVRRRARTLPHWQLRPE